MRYYSKRLDFFGAEQLFIIDDGSSIDDINTSVAIVDTDCLPEKLPDGVILFRFNKHLGRNSLKEFPGWWRSLSFSYVLMEKYGYDKIVHIESDAYVISSEMTDYIRDVQSGWTCFYCPMYDFPETAIQVICKDSVSELGKIWQSGVSFWSQSMLAEFTLPFTNINKAFTGDRYSEDLLQFFSRPIDEIDYVCQAHPLVNLADRLRPTDASLIDWCLVRMFSLISRLIFKSAYTMRMRARNEMSARRSRKSYHR